MDNIYGYCNEMLYESDAFYREGWEDAALDSNFIFDDFDI